MIDFSGSGSPQTIKIQAIQTNPTTGAKQIVAIPISASNFAQASSANTIQIGSSGKELFKSANNGSKILTNK